MSKELQIRNSTVDFLVFTRDAGEDGIEVRVQNGDVWLTQKAISQLFDVDRSEVTKHLSNIFKEGELDGNSVCAKFAQTADDGKTYNYKFYSLAAIIAVGYRINSERATQFRTWATKVLDTFTKQGYVLDKSRLINILSILLLRFRKSEQVREEFLFATKGGKYGILYIKALSRNEKGKSKYETRTR